MTILKPEQVLFAIKATADYLLGIVKGKNPMPYRESEVCYHLWASHITKRVKGKVKANIWVGQLFFATTEESVINELVREINCFLKTKGLTEHAYLPAPTGDLKLE